MTLLRTENNFHFIIMVLTNFHVHSHSAECQKYPLNKSYNNVQIITMLIFNTFDVNRVKVSNWIQNYRKLALMMYDIIVLMLLLEVEL